MTGHESPTVRFYRFVGWLLTPLVAWAVSFLGGWLGAAMGSSAKALLIGSISGAVVGAAGWGILMTRLGVKGQDKALTAEHETVSPGEPDPSQHP